MARSFGRRFTETSLRGRVCWLIWYDSKLAGVERRKFSVALGLDDR